jgi:hypothetical protein
MTVHDGEEADGGILAYTHGLSGLKGLQYTTA